MLVHKAYKFCIEAKLSKALRILLEEQRVLLTGINNILRLHESMNTLETQDMITYHKLSTKAIKKQYVIRMEYLQVSNMLKNIKLAKASNEVSWSQISDYM
ncbi:hypothetical protein IKE_05890 [Bacillus cereus VD196]|uniref:Uncharacterized protein n=1 Tax=Bacillus cereus VD196 TaxID=1053243 RepID=A0A9W5PYG9_BACCE|nr:hypothetical protein [Bacillus cereus]EJR93399.1 hypothetical protein IKG_05515 [Bacillus cereus VD200]EOO61616.1 hypothetical protein IKE_05890 [Bacillus cereus VD196]